MYMQRVVIYPQLGKAFEMQQHLESWVKIRQAQGAKVGLSRQMIGAEGSVLVLTVRLNDLSELEQTGKRMDTDQAFRDFLIKLGTLSRIPVKTELLESLLPLPN